MYAYIKEELISSLLESGNMCSESLFVDPSHIHQEAVIQQQSTQYR